MIKKRELFDIGNLILMIEGTLSMILIMCSSLLMCYFGAMASFKIRPRFKDSLKGKQSEIEETLIEELKKNEAFIYHHLSGHVYIKLNPSEQHFWSPQLNLSFEQNDDEVIIRGLYGPNPTLWAVFFFGYVIIGLVSLGIGVWGMSKWMLGQDITILWLLPAMAIIALVMYIAAQTGQKLGAQQMFDIHHFYESVFKHKIGIT